MVLSDGNYYFTTVVLTVEITSYTEVENGYDFLRENLCDQVNDQNIRKKG